MESARGSLSEQPWGLTLGTLARRSATGELTISEGAMRIVLAFETGRLVAATSTMRAASLLERAARTFELTRGSYTISDQVTLRLERGAAVDLRCVVFAGARKYLPDDRLGMELRELGSRYMLANISADEIARYGLETSQRIIEGLRDGGTLAELEARYHDVDARELRAAVYALVCCGAARGLLPARAPTSPGAGRTPTPNAGRAPTPPGGPRTITPGSTPPASRTTTPATSRTTTPATSRTTTPATSRTTTPLTDRTPTKPISDRTPTKPDRPPRAPSPDPSRTITPDTASRSDATPVPLARIPTVNVARSKTPPDAARTKTPPDAARAKTSDVGRAPTREHALDAPTVRDAAAPQAIDPPTLRDPTFGRTATRVTPAGGVRVVGGPVVSGRVTPAGGVAIIGGAPPRITPAGGVPIANRGEADAAADRARRHLAADAHEQAAREAATAARLAPDNFDHQALHAWASFLAARDRPAAAETARKVLEKASNRAAAPNEVRFLLGRLERMVGRDREALRHFKAVLERDPKHVAAATQLRELEAELDKFAQR